MTLQSDENKSLIYEAKFADESLISILQFPELPIDYDSVGNMKLIVDGVRLAEFKDFYLLTSTNFKTIIFSKQISPSQIKLVFSGKMPLQKYLEMNAARLKISTIFSNHPPLYFNSYVYGDELRFKQIDYINSNRYVNKGFSAQESE
jgi:hypothetical protein